MGNRPTHSNAGRSWPRDVRDLFRGSRPRRHNDRHRAGGAGAGDGPTDDLVDGTTGDECPSAVVGHPARGTTAGGSAGGRVAHFDKLNSCPDLQSVSKSDQQRRLRTLQETERQPVKVNYKIYRSYGELPADGANSSNPRLQASCVDIPVVEVRVYRRSTETLSGAASADRRRAQSLPRGMELRRSLGSDLHGGAEALSTATYDSRRGSTSYSRSTSRKASARSSMASIAASCRAVTPDEFPDTTTVRRKVEDFERNFVAVFTDAFQCLAPLNQLAAVSIATRPDRANQAVSLLQYLESDAIPADLLLQQSTAAAPGGSSLELNGLASSPLPPEDREYFLTIKPSRFPAVRRLKLEGSSAVDRRLSVARELAADMAQEAAAELGRMFEYQLSLIIEPVAVRLLARHAVDCILQATRRRSRTLDRNALVRGVVRGRPPAADGPKFVSVFVGTRELKWNLYEVFKKPALRRELHGCNGRPGSGVSGCALNGGGSCGGSSVAISSGLFPSSPARQSDRGSSGNNSEMSDDGGRLTGSWSVWNFYTSSKCDPMRYGYRGQMVERDYVFGCYRINSEDESSFPEEVTTRYDDFHRVYSSVRRLASLDTLRDYCACAMRSISAGSCNSSGSSDATSATAQLSEFLRRSVTAESYLRDEVDVVFRPLGVALGDYFLERAPSNPVELATLVGTIVNRGGLRTKADKRRSRVLSWQPQQQQQQQDCECPYPYKPPRDQQQQQQRHVTLSLSAETIVNRRRTTSGAMSTSGTMTTAAAAVTGNGTGNNGGNISAGVKEGVTNAAIEVTRACDELSGRLMRTDEFDVTSAAVNGGHVMTMTLPTDDQTTITDV